MDSSAVALKQKLGCGGKCKICAGTGREFKPVAGHTWLCELMLAQKAPGS